jgi:hypothetical protein
MKQDATESTDRPISDRPISDRAIPFGHEGCGLAVSPWTAVHFLQNKPNGGLV